MKILIISDTHRKHENLERVLERVQPVDLLIHLGDAEGYEDAIAEIAGCPIEVVAGNNDFFSILPREKEITIGKYKVLITHGHYYYVNAGTVGSAMLTGIAVGCFADLEDAAAHMVEEKEMYYPREEMHQKYKNIYQRYRRLYDAVRPLM